jgi:hypothetical protein
MKNLLLLLLTTMMMTGCFRSNVPETVNRYEVMLRSGDTIYVESYEYIVKSNKVYRFIRQNYSVVADINDPVYVKQLENK